MKVFAGYGSTYSHTTFAEGRNARGPSMFEVSSTTRTSSLVAMMTLWKREAGLKREALSIRANIWTGLTGVAEDKDQ